MTRTMPSSTSTSTSQICVPKPPSAPSVLSCTPAPIGPPICGALAASSASVSGSNWAAVGRAGWGAPVFPFHRFGVDLPDFCGALAQGGDDLVRRLRHHHRGSKQYAAAAGQIRKPDCGRVADQDRDAPVVDAEQIGAEIVERGA